MYFLDNEVPGTFESVMSPGLKRNDNPEDQ